MSQIPTERAVEKEQEAISALLARGFAVIQTIYDAEGGTIIDKSLPATTTTAIFEKDPVPADVYYIISGISAIFDADPGGNVNFIHNDKVIYRIPCSQLIAAANKTVEIEPRVLKPGDRFKIEVENKDTVAHTIDAQILGYVVKRR